MRKNESQKNLVILILSFGITNVVLKLTKLVDNHLQEKQQNPFFSFSEKSR